MRPKTPPTRCALPERPWKFGNDDVIALSAGGWALAYVGLELDDGMAFIDRALELGPNLAAAWMYSGWTRIFLGDHETAIKHFGNRCE